MQTSHKIALAASLLWMIVQLVMLGLFGIGHGGDTDRYLGAGRDIIEGTLPTGKAASYMSYNLTVAASFALGVGEAGVVIFQLIASAIAAYCMYAIARSQWNQYAGYAAAFLYVAFLKLHPWNTYILTDSLFISFIIITAYLFTKAITTRQTRFIICTALSALFTTFLRPDGLAIPIAFAIVALLTIVKHHAWKTLTLLILTAALIAPTAWQFAGRLASHEFLVEHYAKGAVIWSYEPYYLHMPGSLPSSITETTHPLLALTYFILNKPFYILTLTGTKMLLFLIHIRPYHSFIHNFLIIIWLVVLYPTTYLTIRKNLGRNGLISTFLISLFLIKALIAGATFADWSGRFFLHVAPILLLFASPTLARIIAKQIKPSARRS